jgi:type II secretory pathway pseudopilin PulG
MNSLFPAHGSAAAKRRHRHHATRVRRGLTLVEMLVATALSLLVILAVTQAFQMVGDNVMASRAVLEMSGQLRGITNQLQNDLAGVTVPVRPWPDAEAGLGYFEYHEGALWDRGLGSSPFPETSVGDVDDVLLFTSRTVGRPFVGQILGRLELPPSGSPDPRPVLIFDATQTNSIESRVAEIAWFTRFNDRDADGNVDPGEVTLHRRQFLVLPNINLGDASIQSLSPGQFYNAFDISVRYQQNANSGAWEKYANSLQDLSRRENRIAHNVAGGYPIDPTDALVVRQHPYFLSRALLVPQGTVVTLGDDGAPGDAGVNDDGDRLSDGTSSVDEMGEAGEFGTDDFTLPIEEVAPGFAEYGEPLGNDTILSFVLSFDVKAYDPEAKLHASTDATDLLMPGDPGYNPAAAMIGQGGYVDLFFARYLPGGWPNSGGLPLGSTSQFAGPPHGKSGLFTSFLPTDRHPSVYDTWSFDYEHDGIDQPLFGLDSSNRNLVLINPSGDGVIDNATNGFDDLNPEGFRVNGVDDVGERETAPPYPVPLRGIQVRFRVIDNASRQVRQVTVSSNFIPE